MKQNLKYINSGFKIPDYYFESFSDRLDTKLNSTNIEIRFTNKSVFLVPECYFETLETRIYTNLKAAQTPIFNLSVNKYWISGIAAVFLLSIMLPIFFHAQDVKQTNEAAKEYLEIHANELSTYEVGILLQDSEIEDLENELIYKNI